jgi:hypothetical protein
MTSAEISVVIIFALAGYWIVSAIIENYGKKLSEKAEISQDLQPEKNFQVLKIPEADFNQATLPSERNGSSNAENAAKTLHKPFDQEFEKQRNPKL